MKLLVVLASVRKGRAGEKVAHWFVERVKEDGRFEPELVDLKELELSYELPATVPSAVKNSEYENEDDRKWAEIVKRNDAVVFVNPEYNHSFPASVKNAVDHLFEEWNGKPAAVVNYGASSNAFSFAAFWVVATWVKMEMVGPRVSIPEVWAAFNENGELAHADYHEYEVKGVLGALEAKVAAKKQ
jgi:NAD(P)H-dependent FMN reductase